MTNSSKYGKREVVKSIGHGGKRPFANLQG